jgi:hypothetical protein
MNLDPVPLGEAVWAHQPTRPPQPVPSVGSHARVSPHVGPVISPRRVLPTNAPHVFQVIFQVDLTCLPLVVFL